MISRDQLQGLIERRANGKQILSAYVDMSVNEENKRTWDIWLSKRKAEWRELASDRPGHHREEIGAAFARLERFLGDEFDQANKGAAMFIELGGDWSEAIQLPLPLANRLDVDARPVVAPLVDVVESYHHHGVVLVDREHLRLFSLYLDQALNERQVETEPYPAPHDIQRGGFSAGDYQKRKAEEARHFFREFVTEVESFVRSHRPDDLIVLGTHENVKKFCDMLPEGVRKLVVHTDRAEIDASIPEIRAKLAPVFRRHLEQEEADAVNRLRDRIRESHRAVSGWDRTLEQLQEGKVETLIIARDSDARGGRCAKCNFLLARTGGACPYCGGEVQDGVDLVEEMVRMAEEQDARIGFVARSNLDDIGGVGGLLRF